MLCRMLRETGVAEIFEYSSLRLHIISLHLFTHIYNYLVKTVGQNNLRHAMLSYGNSIL